MTMNSDKIGKPDDTVTQDDTFSVDTSVSQLINQESDIRDKIIRQQRVTLGEITAARKDSIRKLILGGDPTKIKPSIPTRNANSDCVFYVHDDITETEYKPSRTARSCLKQSSDVDNPTVAQQVDEHQTEVSSVEQQPQDSSSKTRVDFSTRDEVYQLAGEKAQQLTEEQVLQRSTWRTIRKYAPVRHMVMYDLWKKNGKDCSDSESSWLDANQQLVKTDSLGNEIDLDDLYIMVKDTYQQVHNQEADAFQKILEQQADEHLDQDFRHLTP